MRYRDTGSIRATTYTKNLRCRLNGIHQDQVISEAQFADLIETAATSNGIERAIQKIIGLTISPQPTQTDAGQSTTRRFRVAQTGTGEPLNKP
jgi:hypothetical protein